MHDETDQRSVVTMKVVGLQMQKNLRKMVSGKSAAGKVVGINES